MPDIAPGVATGRTACTYYQTATRAAPGTWNKITLVSGSESFDPGKENTIAGEVRESGRKYQESGAQEGASLKFTYQRPRGITDAVFTALLASYAAGGTRPEFAVMDDDITKSKTVGWRFYGKVVGLEHKRDLDKFIEYDVTIEERVTYEVQAAGGAPLAQELVPFAVT
jgi:hypothetical protein